MHYAGVLRRRVARKPRLQAGRRFPHFQARHAGFCRYDLRGGLPQTL